MSDLYLAAGRIMAAAIEREKDRRWLRWYMEMFYREMGMRPKRLSFKRPTR